MSAVLARVGGVLLLALLIWLVVAAIRRYVERSRHQALAGAPPLPAEGMALGSDGEETRQPVRILAFGSEDCAPCHRLQAPALRRVEAARGSTVTVVEIDAPSSPELTSRYRVLTLPTTVVLDGTGQAREINYGFANSERLIAQVDAALDPADGATAEPQVQMV